MGASAATTAFCDCSCASSFALPPVTQPPNMKPTNAQKAAPPTAPQRICSTFGDNFMENFMTNPFARYLLDANNGYPAGHSVGVAICKRDSPDAKRPIKYR